MLTLAAKYGANLDVEKLLPHPTTISRNIGKVYKTTYEKGYGLTSDLWTDNYLKSSHLSLSIHFIKYGKLVTKLLAFKSMDMEPCTSKYSHNFIKFKLLIHTLF